MVTLTCQRSSKLIINNHEMERSNAQSWKKKKKKKKKEKMLLWVPDRRLCGSWGSLCRRRPPLRWRRRDPDDRRNRVCPSRRSSYRWARLFWKLSLKRPFCWFAGSLQGWVRDWWSLCVRQRLFVVATFRLILLEAAFFDDGNLTGTDREPIRIPDTHQGCVSHPCNANRVGLPCLPSLCSLNHHC